MAGANQGFVKPNRNASSWDSDVNGNFTLSERGFVMPFVVGSTAVTTGQLLHAAISSTTLSNSAPIANIYGPYYAENQTLPPSALALQAGSPGNTIYGLVQGVLTDFAAFCGQLTNGDWFGASVDTPGWLTNSLDRANMFVLGRAWANGTLLFNPTGRPPSTRTQTVSGMAHCASTTLGVFSFFFESVGIGGFNSRLRIRSLSCDNYRVTIFSNSGKSTIIYDTAINSGNLGVRTIDLVDAAMWPYSLDAAGIPPLWGALHGTLEVLSSAATAINSQNFQINADFVRLR